MAPRAAHMLAWVDDRPGGPMRPTDAPLLRRSPLFARMTDAHISGLLLGTFAQTLPKGTTLCVQDERPEFLHIVMDGRVGLFADNKEGQRTVVEFFGCGDAFIAPAAMLDAPYLMTATLIADSRILMWPAGPFRAALKSDPDLSYGMSMLLAGYWRSLVGQIKDLKLHTAVQRVAGFLVKLSPREHGPVTVRLPEGRNLIAARVGISPECFSRAYAVLKHHGVSGGGRDVTIDDPQRLRDLAGGGWPTLPAPAAAAATRRPPVNVEARAT